MKNPASGASGGGSGSGVRRSRFRLLSGLRGCSASKDLQASRASASASSPPSSYIATSELSGAGGGLNGDSSSDASSSTNTPVLLSVRKRSCSDSGHDSCCSSSCSHTDGGGVSATPSPQPPTDRAAGSSSRTRGFGFFRLFHRSATLLFQHPQQADLNPGGKPYKGQISSSSKDLRQKKAGARYHQNKGSNAHAGQLGTQSGQLSSSSSSLNSGFLLHHHLEHVDEPRPRSSTRSPSSSAASSSLPRRISASRRRSAHQAARRGPAPLSLPLPLHSSSSNSVISSSAAEADADSNYDSGAFSRTSTPESLPNNNGAAAAGSAPAPGPIRHMAKHNSLSMSSLAISAPLSAPSLVLAACQNSQACQTDDFTRHHRHCPEAASDAQPSSADVVDAAHILACLNAASEPSSIVHAAPNPAWSSGGRLASSADVSITVGANTKLTISPMSTNLRRSRSGLPVLGMTGLGPQKPSRLRSPAPAPATERTRISTVYLTRDVNRNNACDAASCSMPPLSTEPENDSSSGQSCYSDCDPHLCSERVTVNGQHHCSHSHRSNSRNSTSGSKPAPNTDYEGNYCSLQPCRDVTDSAQAANADHSNEDAENQPSSLIHI